MTITETTKPAPRTFSLEFTENELMNLGLMVGQIVPNDMKNLIDNKSWESSIFPGIVYEDIKLYDKIVDILKSNPQLNQSDKKVDLTN